jgi:hypothetical protein
MVKWANKYKTFRGTNTDILGCLIVRPISRRLLYEVNVLAVNGFLLGLCTKEKHGGSERGEERSVASPYLTIYIECPLFPLKPTPPADENVTVSFVHARYHEFHFRHRQTLAFTLPFQEFNVQSSRITYVHLHPNHQPSGVPKPRAALHFYYWRCVTEARSEQLIPNNRSAGNKQMNDVELSASVIRPARSSDSGSGSILLQYYDLLC